jgi:hypothetical protein
MVVRKGAPVPNVRTWYSFAGYASTYEYIVHNSSLVNVCRGLVERVFCVVRDGKLQRPLRPKDNIFERKLGDIGRKVSRIVGFCPAMTRAAFCASYSGKRRATYEKARLSLDVLPCTRKDSYLKTFVKAEKINVTLKPDPAPRVIQPRDPRYNVEVGRYLKPLEPRLMKAIDKLWGEKTAIKGYTVEQVGSILYEKSLRFKNPVFVGLDAHRFDQHCSRQALEWEHSVYNAVIRDPYLAELLTWQVDNKGSAFLKDGFVRYNVDGCRMSGDMNTSMGNYLIMSCLIFAFCRDIGLDASLANCGDDCVLFLEKDDLKRLKALPQWFNNMGYSMKVEKPVYDVERIEFCQQHPVRLSRGWVMVRRPDVCLTKDVCVVRGGMTSTRLQRWLHAQRDGGLSLAGDCPVLASFYAAFPDGNAEGEESEYAEPHKFKAEMQCGEITSLSRFSFWLAFGLTPDEQLAIEAELEKWKPIVEFGDALKQPTLLDYCSR